MDIPKTTGVHVVLSLAPAWLVIVALWLVNALAGNLFSPRALNGIPVIVTAFGSFWVASSLLLRPQVDKLRRVVDTAESYGRALIEPPPNALPARERRYNLKAEKATDAIKFSKRQLGEWKAAIVGLERSGAALLALGALGAFAVWLLLP
ncbi:hypothetical protein [Plantibacter sp. T3]|uniref:hypothetical protein n=1 Tax=Plantibacter sp. T3 TaxID=2653161 RepID=UPI0013583AD6|nr:hypothetical protein [Plantibacter sp. T3]